MGDFQRVCKLTELEEGDRRIFKVGGRDILLLKAGGEVFAVGNWCTHESGDLSQGKLFGHTLKCPEHGAEFDVRTGKAMLGPDGDEPSTIPQLDRYEVKLQGGEVYVKA